MEHIKTFYSENKSTVLWVAGIAGLIIIVVGGYFLFSSDSSSEAGKAGVENKTEEPKPVYTSNKPKVVVEAPKISYAEALLKYKNSTIQFSDKCETIVFRHVYKNGTEIMLDNRGTAKMFRVGENQLNIASYDFAIVKLQSDVFPKTIAIDCGSKQNVSEISIER